MHSAKAAFVNLLLILQVGVISSYPRVVVAHFSMTQARNVVVPARSLDSEAETPSPINWTLTLAPFSGARRSEFKAERNSVADSTSGERVRLPVHPHIRHSIKTQ